MQVYLTLVRRELGSFFASLTGYVVIASVLLLLGLSFDDVLAKLQSSPTDAPVTELFYGTVYFWWIFLLSAPVITMRSFAFEKWSGTFETLMTTPVSDLQVVLAKFTGTWTFYILTWLPLLGCVAVVRYYTNEPTVFDPWTMLSTFADPRPDRRAAPDVLVEVGIRPTPVGVKEAVDAIPRDRHW